MPKKKYYSVNEVCSYVGISRSTFYRHYAKCMNAHEDTKKLTRGVSKRYPENVIDDCILGPANGKPDPKPDGPKDPPLSQPKLPGLDDDEEIQ